MRLHSLEPNRGRLRRAFSLLPLILMVSGVRAASGQSAGHPLDPLTWDEHWIVLDAIRTADHAMLRIDLEHPALWRVINPAADNHLGYPVSYQLVPGANAVSLLDRDDYPQMRAGFTDYHLWVTPYRADERHAAGLYPTLSEPGHGLPAWTGRTARSVTPTS